METEPELTQEDVLRKIQEKSRLIAFKQASFDKGKTTSCYEALNLQQLRRDREVLWGSLKKPTLAVDNT